MGCHILSNNITGQGFPDSDEIFSLGMLSDSG
uniref:Uncharacterized protein n=1 Tax=Anguilla anguilla TaxID=7936 RepID=A0A0E9SX44_ANGAN